MTRAWPGVLQLYKILPLRCGLGAGLVGEVVLDLGPVAPLRLLAVVLKVEPQLAHLPLVLGLEITCLGVDFFLSYPFLLLFYFKQ